MNLFILVWNYLKARPLNTAINIILLSLGIAVITILLLFNKQLESKITENAKGIDLVVGAKGSPMQLILCNIFHIDLPTGNIPLREAERIAKHRLVKKAIPLALGDSYKNYRIVGTNHDYASIYKGEIAEGKWFNQDLEVTIGANVRDLTGLKIGDKFESAHGLVEGGHAHNEHLYIVTGIMRPANNVLDNLILTNVPSIWQMHEAGAPAHVTDFAEQKMEIDRRSRLVPSVSLDDTTRQLTSMLIQYRSGMGAVVLPRTINSQSSLQAASPAFETARLFSIVGIGVDILMAFAYVLIVVSGLSIFIALYNSLKERRYDLAILRSMGASRNRLFISVLLEGLVLTLLGTVIGLFMAHGMVEIVAAFSSQMRKAGISGLIFFSEEWIILAGSLFLGLLCGLIPAIQAYRTDISKVLAGNA
jgi:putative ABC transport system permease protein